MRPILGVIALASLSLVSCTRREPDMTLLKRTVDEYNAASKDAMLGGNSEKVMSYYEEGAISMPPNMAVIKGKEAIKAFQQQMMKSGVKITAVKFNTVELDAGGKVAYEVGTYEMSMTTPSMGDMKDNGKYIALWRQQRDGSWKVHAETWNTDMPMPPMDQTAKKEDMKKDKKK